MMNSCLQAMTDQPDKKMLIQIVVDEQYSDLLRRTIFCACGENISFLTAQPVPHSHDMRFWFTTTSSKVVDAFMSAIMHALPQAEFGRYSYL
jgi:hypothetical protein